VEFLQGLTNFVRGDWEMVDTKEGRFRQRKITYRQVIVHTITLGYFTS